MVAFKMLAGKRDKCLKLETCFSESNARNKIKKKKKED
jgi:hypothetical protein